MTKFSIMIGSLHAYLPHNRRAIMWLSNYRHPIWTFCNWTPVIGYPRDLHINCVHFSGFLCNVSYSFQNLWNALHTFSLKRSSQKTFLIPITITNRIYMYMYKQNFRSWLVLCASICASWIEMFLSRFTSLNYYEVIIIFSLLGCIETTPYTLPTPLSS